MKKLRNILLIVCLFSIIGITIFNSNTVINQGLDEKPKKEITEYLNSNSGLFNKLKTLETYAKEYVEANGNTGSVTDLALAYIRKDTYADQMWSTLLGEVDSNFVAYVQSKDASFNITASDKLYDAKTGIEIDFIHLAATLSVYNMYGTSVNDISTDYGGWAGDLLTVMAEVINYKNANGITDQNALKTYATSILGTNKPSSYSVYDALADIDAVNIYSTGTLGTSFYNTITNYYSNNGTNNYYNRYATIQKILGTKDQVIATATSLLSNMRAQLVIIPGVPVTASDISLMAELFASYIYEEGYIELSSASSTNRIGDKVTIPIVHKHTTNATIKTDSNIATAAINGNNLIITCKNYGQTKIEITPNGGNTATYNITVLNVAPSITTNLPTSIDVNVGTDKKISFAANGTNNSYTWYLSNNGKDNSQLLTTTTSPSMTLKPKANMNGKYVICYIKNEGNSEIATVAMKINVIEEKPKEEQPKEEKPKEEPKEDESLDNDTVEDDDDVIVDDDIVVEIPENNNDNNPSNNDNSKESKMSTKTIILIVIGVFELIVASALVTNLSKKKNI